MTVITTPDLAAVKQRQQATWSSGDFHMIGNQIVLTSEMLIETLDIHAGERVLDVATGSGNAALAAARRGAEVVGVDYVPALLERGRRRADAEVLDVTFVEGDAEALPFPDGSFDVVSTVFGAMFAPDQERAARELLRVVRPGGRIGIAAHTPDGFIGDMFRTNARHIAPPAGVASPILWGTEPRLRDLFGDAIAELRTERRMMVLRARSPEAFIDYWRTYYGPTLKAFEAVGESGQAALRADLLDLLAGHDRAGDGTLIVDSEYLEAVIVTR